MRRTLLSAALLPLICLAAPIHAQAAEESDSAYLQNRAAGLIDRIELAVREHKLSKRKAAKLSTSVGQVQTRAGNLQTRNGTIEQADVDQLNQQLTDVERKLTNQP